MSGRTEQIAIGLIALSLLPVIVLRVRRGLAEGRLPIYRTHLERGESEAKFIVLLLLHAVAFILVAVAAADLLLGLGLKERL